MSTRRLQHLLESRRCPPTSTANDPYRTRTYDHRVDVVDVVDVEINDSPHHSRCCLTSNVYFSTVEPMSGCRGSCGGRWWGEKGWNERLQRLQHLLLLVLIGVSLWSSSEAAQSTATWLTNKLQCPAYCTAHLNSPFVSSRNPTLLFVQFFLYSLLYYLRPTLKVKGNK